MGASAKTKAWYGSSWGKKSLKQKVAMNGNAEKQMRSTAGKGVQAILGVNPACCQNNLSLFYESSKLLTSLSRCKMSPGSVRGSSILKYCNYPNGTAAMMVYQQ